MFRAVCTTWSHESRLLGFDPFWSPLVSHMHLADDQLDAPLGFPFQGSLASDLAEFSSGILSHAYRHMIEIIRTAASQSINRPLPCSHSYQTSETTLVGFCASTIPIFDFIQTWATEFTSRQLVHHCHSPTILRPNGNLPELSGRPQARHTRP